MFGNNLGFESALTVAWYFDIDRANIGQDFLGAMTIAAVTRVLRQRSCNDMWFLKPNSLG